MVRATGYEVVYFDAGALFIRVYTAAVYEACPPISRRLIIVLGIMCMYTNRIFICQRHAEAVSNRFDLQNYHTIEPTPIEVELDCHTGSGSDKTCMHHTVSGDGACDENGRFHGAIRVSA